MFGWHPLLCRSYFLSNSQSDVPSLHLWYSMTGNEILNMRQILYSDTLYTWQLLPIQWDKCYCKDKLCQNDISILTLDMRLEIERGQQALVKLPFLKCKNANWNLKTCSFNRRKANFSIIINLKNCSSKLIYIKLARDREMKMNWARKKIFNSVFLRILETCQFFSNVFKNCFF